MRKSYKETEKAWIETMYLWKKKGLLVLVSPKNTHEKRYALLLQKEFQQRLISQEINPAIFEISEPELADLIEHEKLLEPEDLLKLYAIAYFGSPWISLKSKNDDMKNVKIIQKQRKIASKTKEIHQRRNWSPV